MGETQSTLQKPNTDESPKVSDIPDEDEFKRKVRASASKFKELVTENKVMIFSATYCSYCTVAKRTLDDIGTKYGSLEVNQAEDGDMMMNVVSAVTGNRMVPAIFICGKLVPGGGSGLKHLATTGQLKDILLQCCEGDITCTKFYDL
eukprot:TRINITY_DN20325_c0_g1_i1.p1 TRINITY_DN20325_c0_g1~~TRINITY_DN20325_c0_g1_i1.p1  ORF type:complete len:147 (-),score=25.52 TRINITY_DN20325_c0_g1_i1:30-470(-)